MNGNIASMKINLCETDSGHKTPIKSLSSIGCIVELDEVIPKEYTKVGSDILGAVLELNPNARCLLVQKYCNR